MLSWNDGGYGYLVEITHPDGTETLSMPTTAEFWCKKVRESLKGNRFQKWAAQASVPGPHLHFEIHTSAQGAVNPMAFLPDDSRTASQ